MTDKNPDSDPRDPLADDHAQTEDSGFDLSAPSSDMAKSRKPRTDSQQSTRGMSDSRSMDSRLTAKPRSGGSEWKGFEEEEEYEPEVDFGSKGVMEEELDMTPMVDVVFLLLIFFMVTASFTMQKSIQQPPMSTDEPSFNVEEREDEDQYVEIIIDQFNTYRLTSKDLEEEEAPSDQEMRVKLRNMVQDTSAKKLIITAHGDATNAKVVTAWDAGIDNNLLDIVIRLSEQDF